MIYSTIIIGGGPAGLTAAIYLGRYELDTLLITDIVGGQTAIAGIIENYPGFMEINGFELISKMKEKVQSLGKVELKTGEPLKEIKKVNGIFEVVTEKSSYSAKTVLIANGKRHRELGLPNEKELIGKGLSYCATCDGSFARDKDVVIVGDGYAACESALILSKIAKSVVMIGINKELSGESTTINKVKNNEKIKTIHLTKTSELTTRDGLVSGLKLVNLEGKAESEINCQMVFVEIGQIPNTDRVSELVEINVAKEIVIDSKTNQTSVEGIYSAGDITDIPAKQTIVAAGEGAKAAIAINRYLDRV